MLVRIGKLLAFVVAGVIGVLLVAMLALVGAGLLFQHLALSVAVVVVAGVFAGLGRWKSFNFRVNRPWLRQGTSAADRRFQERWEREHVAQRLRGGQGEPHWRE